MRRALFGQVLFAGLLVAQCHGRAFAQRADFRPYGDLGVGLLSWGKDSPCRCKGANPAATFGLTLPGHLRLGLRLDHVRTLRDGWWLGPEASYGFLPYQRLRLVAAWRAPLRRDDRTEEFQVQVIDTEYSGYGSAFDLRYLPWAKRQNGRGWWIAAGYRSLTERATERADGNLTSRTKVTHIGWQVGIGYQL